MDMYSGFELYRDRAGFFAGVISLSHEAVLFVALAFRVRLGVICSSSRPHCTGFGGTQVRPGLRQAGKFNRVQYYSNPRFMPEKRTPISHPRLMSKLHENADVTVYYLLMRVSI